jgi:hypothetical protein
MSIGLAVFVSHWHYQGKNKKKVPCPVGGRGGVFAFTLHSNGTAAQRIGFPTN